MQSKISPVKFMNFTRFASGRISVAVVEEVVTHIIKELSLEEEKVIVVAIAGPTRSGKSFLLNLLLHYHNHCQRQNSIAWNESQDPIKNINWASGGVGVTKGIWVCNKPIQARNREGEKVNILLMDTQGLGDDMLNLDGKIDRLLVVSSLQLSDLLIYNVVGRTSSHDLNGIFSNLKALDAIKQEQPLFNNLMFLYRDYISTRNYGLQPHMFQSKAENYEAEFPGEHNPYRSILKAFRNTTSFTCPHPGDLIQQASEKDDLILSDKNISPEFVDNMKSLFDVILGFEEDNSYFNDLVKNAKHGYEILHRLQKLKEWIENEHNTSKEEELEHVSFQNKVEQVFENWNQQVQKSFELTVKEKKEFALPSTTQFMKNFEELTIHLKTLPIYSVYYQKLENLLSTASGEWEEMVAEFLNCKTDSERFAVLKKCKMESLLRDPAAASRRIKILAAICGVTLLAATGIAIGIAIPPLGIIEIAIAATLSGTLGVTGFVTGIVAGVMKKKTNEG